MDGLHRMYARHTVDDDIPEDIQYSNENVYHNYRHRSHVPMQACEQGPSHSEVAEALAQRILADRDQAMERMMRAEAVAQSVGDERNLAVAAATQAEHMLHQVACERDELACELDLTQDLLADAAARGERACRRVRELEACVAKLLKELPDAQAPAAPREPEDASAFGLSRTKEAVSKAVAEAAKLPADERGKKLRQLRLKWHPDKHDVLKDLAEEVCIRLTRYGRAWCLSNSLVLLSRCTRLVLTSPLTGPVRDSHETCLCLLARRASGD